MTDDQSEAMKVITAMFGLLTARLEDAACLAADGQDPAADHRPITSQIASYVAEASILVDAIEVLVAMISTGACPTDIV